MSTLSFIVTIPQHDDGLWFFGITYRYLGDASTTLGDPARLALCWLRLGAKGASVTLTKGKSDQWKFAWERICYCLRPLTDVQACRSCHTFSQWPRV